MADIKALLGDKYKDGMTFDEVSAVFAELNLVDSSALDKTVSKETFDKTASELAAIKKQLKGKLTAEENAAAQRSEEFAAIQAELEALRSEKALSDSKARFLSLGYDEKLAGETAAAYVKGDTDTVFANQKKFLETREQTIKADLLKNTPAPPAGNTATGQLFDTEFKAAQDSNDSARMAALIRQQHEAAVKNE